MGTGAKKRKNTCIHTHTHIYIYIYNTQKTHGVEDGVELRGVTGVGHQLAHVADDERALALGEGLCVVCCWFVFVELSSLIVCIHMHIYLSI